MSECWDIVNGTATMPRDGPRGSTAEHVATAITAKSAYTNKYNEVASILTNSISNDQVHFVLTVHEDPVAIWNQV